VELLYEVALRVDVLGEDDQPTVGSSGGRGVGEHVLADPPEQVRARIRASGRRAWARRERC
jgi:hypothetical protein